jgi:hypothetical protein
MRIDDDPYNPLTAGSTTKSGNGALSMNYRVYVKESLPDG